MKKIVLTQRLCENKDNGELRNVLDIRWGNFLLSMDFLPIIIPVGVGLDSYDSIGIDGIILTGGNDLSLFCNDKVSKIRDTHEYDCIKYSIENSIPIFGVCRGMQVIAEYFDCTIKKVENHANRIHKIKTINKSNDFKYIRKLDKVNSYHNYAIDNLSSEFSIVSISKDDNIEAITHKKYKIFAQMWHPERSLAFDNYNKKHLSDFFNDNTEG